MALTCGATGSTTSEVITQINTNEANIATNVTDIATNVTDIATNVTDIALKANITDINVANSAYIKTAINAGGNAPIYACRVWVNFNGMGTPEIRASGNVSSITDNGAGDYRINFATGLLDTGYAVSIQTNGTDTWNNRIIDTVATSFRFLVEDGGSDYGINTVAVFR